MTERSSPDSALPDWEDPDVQTVYKLMVDDSLNEPPHSQHWEGWIARHIVQALRRAPAQAAPSREAIEKALCCPKGCLRDDDCFVTTPGAKVRYTRTKHEREQTEAILALCSQPAVPQTVLWCCHARGPDDVYAAPDYETALAWSDALNEINWSKSSKLEIKDPASWDECLIRATPALWPHSPESHAEDLPKSIKGFSDPETLSRPQRQEGT